MIEISKELLLELKLFDNIENRDWIYEVDKNTLKVIYNMTNYFDGNVFTINIYELAHKCKEWALSKGYYLHSHTKEYSDCWCIVKSLDNITQQLSCEMDTEVEAIIKACEWILSKIKEGN